MNPRHLTPVSVGLSLVVATTLGAVSSCAGRSSAEGEATPKRSEGIGVTPSNQIPPDLKAARDEAVAAAEVEIHRGLVQLAKRFPQLESSVEWQTILNPLDAAPGWLEIRLYHYQPKQPPDPTPEQERFHVTVDVRPPPPPGSDVPFVPLYPRLGLVGRINIDAGDRELQSALEDLLQEALLPLGRLEERGIEAETGQ